MGFYLRVQYEFNRFFLITWSIFVISKGFSNCLSIRISDSSLKGLWLSILHSSPTKIQYNKLTKKIIGGSPTKAIAVLSFLLLPPLLSKNEKKKNQRFMKTMIQRSNDVAQKNVYKYGISKLSRYINAQCQH